MSMKEVVQVAAASVVLYVLLRPKEAEAHIYEAEVHVANELTRAPVSGALVSCGGVTALTDAAGLAMIVLALPGEYDLTVSREGYEPYAGSFTVPE